MPFAVHHYNFGTVTEFETEAEARAFVLRAHFEAVVSKNGDRIASWSPIGGWR